VSETSLKRDCRAEQNYVTVLCQILDELDGIFRGDMLCDLEAYGDVEPLAEIKRLRQVLHRKTTLGDQKAALVSPCAVNPAN
jgi:hypothetical protein